MKVNVINNKVYWKLRGLLVLVQVPMNGYPVSPRPVPFIVGLISDSLLERDSKPEILQSCLLCKLMKTVESQGALVNSFNRKDIH